MESQEYPVRHFSQMAELALALNALPAQVLEHDYSYESFGSWSMTVRYLGVPLRVVYDGKEHHAAMERSTSKRAPYAWEATVWEQEVGSESGPAVEDLVEAIRAGVTAG